MYLHPACTESSESISIFGLSHQHFTLPSLHLLPQCLLCEWNQGRDICQVVLLYVLFRTFENGKRSHLRQLANCRQERRRAAAGASAQITAWKWAKKSRWVRYFWLCNYCVSWKHYCIRVGLYRGHSATLTTDHCWRWMGLHSNNGHFYTCNMIKCFATWSSKLHNKLILYV